MDDYKYRCPFGCRGSSCVKSGICVKTGRRLDYSWTTSSEWTAGIAFLVVLAYSKDLAIAGMAAIAAYFVSKLRVVKTMLSAFAALVFIWIFGSAFGLIEWNPFTSLLANQ